MRSLGLLVLVFSFGFSLRYSTGRSVLDRSLDSTGRSLCDNEGIPLTHATGVREDGAMVCAMDGRGRVGDSLVLG